MLTPASAATSSRRRPGVRRTPVAGAKPTSAGVTWLRRARRKRPSSVPPVSWGCSAAMPPVCPDPDADDAAEGALSHPRWPLPRTSRPAAVSARWACWGRGEARINDVSEWSRTQHDRYRQDPRPGAARGYRARTGTADRRCALRAGVGRSGAVPARPEPDYRLRAGRAWPHRAAPLAPAPGHG